MSVFTVYVQKDYYNRDDGDVRTVEGHMEIEAESQADANAVVRKEMQWHKDGSGGIKTLQTTDPRIEWDEDWSDLDDLGYEYVDFSFKLVVDADE